MSNDGLSLNIVRDAFGLSMMMDDQMQRINMYERVIADIRKALGDDGLHAQLLDLPRVVAERIKPEAESRQRAQVCADHGCQVLPEHRHAARIAEVAEDAAKGLED